MPRRSLFIALYLIPALVALPPVATVAAAPAKPAPAPAATPAPKGYEGFRLVRTLNIFDPDRRGPRTSESRSVTSRSQSRGDRNRTPYIALTGTMVTPDRALAFFAGSQSEYNKVVPLQEKIADFTITGITTAQVDMERGGKKFMLVIGKQLTLDNATVSTFQPETASSTSDDSSSSSDSPSDADKPNDTPPDGAPASTAPPAGVPGDKNDLLRRMMERRQKELSQ